MKTYQELTAEQQAKAVDKCLTDLLTAIMEGAIRFNDKANHNDLQARIDKAGDKANQMQTPWFWSEHIMETCKDDLESVARAEAEDALYSEQERVIAGIAA